MEAMDFHSLTRKELQTLCKKNKIPANITNVAMADALKALEIVSFTFFFFQLLSIFCFLLMEIITQICESFDPIAIW